MKFPNLDFKELVVFQALMKHRKVSQVANEIGLSQPSISRCLSRLREHFNDQLFVRTRHSMEPTPSALEIAPAIDKMLNLYHSELSQKRHFDPASSKRTFRIASSELGHLLLFPSFLKKLEKTAPNVTLKASPLGLHSLIGELETGEVDVAFGAFPSLYAGIHERTLFTEHYVCLVRSDHPDIGDKMSLSDYENAKHIIISAEGMGHFHEQVEKQLYDACPQENIRVISHSFLFSALMVEQTDFVVTAPSKLMAGFGPQHNLRVVKTPMKLPSFDVKQYWHERFHREPANQWIRREMADCFK